MTETRHEGVLMTGHDGEDGPKAFYIELEARPGHQEDVAQILRDIRACVEDEPATGPWYAVRSSDTSFAIFETFRAELDEHHDRRERIIKASRDITASSKKMYRTMIESSLAEY